MAQVPRSLVNKSEKKLTQVSGSGAGKNIKKLTQVSVVHGEKDNS